MIEKSRNLYIGNEIFLFRSKCSVRHNRQTDGQKNYKKFLLVRGIIIKFFSQEISFSDRRTNERTDGYFKL